jgi:hypothetical protein
MLAGYLQFKPEFCDVDANILKIQNHPIKILIFLYTWFSNPGYLFKIFRAGGWKYSGRKFVMLSHTAAEKDAAESGIAERQISILTCNSCKSGWQYCNAPEDHFL